MLGADETDIEWEKQCFRNHLAVLLRQAYYDARKNGKRKTKDEQIFEINEDENLELLLDDIMNRRYKPSRGVRHVIWDPVAREIVAAPFRDRVVHHLIYNLVYDWWAKQFIYDTYSCMVGRGTLMGIRRLDYHIRSVSGNYAREVVIVKLDIRNFFVSIPRWRLLKLALEGLEKQYKSELGREEYKMLKYLWEEIIMDDPMDGIKTVGRRSDWLKLPPEKILMNQKPGIGIVIGNLTSQLLSNIFLNQLDRYVRFELGYKHYGRYVDDFYIVVSAEQREQLKRDVKAIERFLAGLGVTLHPKKRHYYTAETGVPFLGAVVHKGYILPGERLKRNFRKACKMVEAGEKDIDTLVSYLGHVEHYNKIRFVSEAFERVAWDYIY